ncbi:MAG TPA: glycosyltransferase [Solirubrobacteraceae bacterium]|nr:glycosyltransferase [Solirubrobacteraceae bacterium]
MTLGIATYNRDTYLGAAVASALAQDYDDFEVLVVCDGSTNPRIDEVLGGFDDARLRVVRHERNRGIAAAYDTFVSEGSGELIAMLGDDDVCMVDRLRRQVELFDADPAIGVVHGDAVVIDGDGNAVGSWPSAELAREQLLQTFVRVHNVIVDPTRMVDRRVYERIGGYDGAFPIAQDFEFWLRAVEHFDFRHCAGGPLVGVRRHGENASDESAHAREIEDVERALEGAIARLGLPRIVPEIDWQGLAEADAEGLALRRLADLLEQRRLPLPGLASRLRARAPARAGQRARELRPDARRLLIAAYGWNDSGGGTAVPRSAARELARRGWDVSVFHAAVRPIADAPPYAVREWEEDGVRLIGVHNRPSALFDIGNPERDLHDPQIAAAFARALDEIDPHVVHFHNLHNLGASLLDATAARGIPSYFSAHNYWLICPRAYLITRAGSICPGPGDRGGDCAACTESADRGGHQRRLADIRARAGRSLTAILAPSASVRRSLLNAGYPPELVDVVRQAMPHDAEIWEQTGSRRRPGRASGELVVGFIGSAYPHKGPQLLVEAAQRTAASVRVEIHGEIGERFAGQLRELDRRGVTALKGAFEADQLAARLASVDAAALPSIWWDCAPLAAAECRAARLPLIAPRLGGLAEVVADERDGLLFDGLDVDDLARQLDRLASEPGLLERLQANIDAPRSFGAYIDELEAYYAGERPGSGPFEAGHPATLWQGEHELALSLAIVNREVTARLPGRVQRVTPRGASTDAPLPQLADVEVRHQWPPDLTPAHAGRLAVIQPWEFGAIPLEWLEPLQENVDELWVPSEFVRSMYLAAGVEPERVVAIPNGVDPALFGPDGERYPLETEPGALRFLFHSGLIWRKGPDVLLAAWREAFAEREDVVLVVKTVGATNVYRSGERSELADHARAGTLPRVLLIEDELSNVELGSLYRACDVFVHPYRGEGFAMGVLEAMASGLPVIVTAGGPTDEFCPPAAGWRINSGLAQFPSDRVDRLETAGRPWVLEPEHAHLVRLLREAAADPAGRAARGAAGREAALALSWDRAAALYAERIAALGVRRPQLAGPLDPDPYPLDGSGRQLLAVPAWRGHDRLGELLAAWCSPAARESGATLVLLADPDVDGEPDALEARVHAAAAEAGCDLAQAGDINLLLQGHVIERDARLAAASDAYVRLHAGCPGHERLARERGTPILVPQEVGAFLEREPARSGAAR